MEEVRKAVASYLPLQSSEMINPLSLNTQDCQTELVSSSLLQLVQRVIQYCPLTRHRMMMMEKWSIVLNSYCEIVNSHDSIQGDDNGNGNSVIQKWLVEGMLKLHGFLHGFYFFHISSMLKSSFFFSL